MMYFSNVSHNLTTPSVDYDVYRVLQILTLLMIFLIGLFLNITVILVYCCSPTLRKVTHNLAVINLILCDLILIFIAIPMSFISVITPYSQVGYFVSHGPFCQMTGYLSVLVSITSSLTLACIAVDRYVAAVYPLAYIRLFKQKHCIAVLAFCWIWAMLTAMPPIMPSKPASYHYHAGTKKCSPSFKDDCWFYWYCMIMGYGIPLPTMAFCYFQISRAVRNHRRKIFSNNTISCNLPTVIGVTNTTTIIPDKITVCLEKNKGVAMSGHVPSLDEKANDAAKKTTNKPACKPQVHIAKRGALLIVAYFVCWGPYAILFSCPGHLHTMELIEVMAMWLAYTLVMWNPLIYVFNNKQFRLELKRLRLKTIK